LVVERFAKVMGMPTTCGALFSKLAYVGGSLLEQIQLAFGDESIATPERYLGGRLNLADAACDRLGIGG
jgi:hypothetical protein